MGRYLTDRLCNPGSDRAQVFCTPYAPSHPGQRGRQRRGLSRPQRVVLRQLVPCGVNAALIVGVIVAVGGGGGVGRRGEARGTPGGGEEFDDWDRKIGWGGRGSVRGGRKRRAAASAVGTGMGSRGQGASSGVADDGDGRGPDDRSEDATLLCFGGGRGSLLPPPINCRGPVDGNCLDRGD